jgi:hypothetical protein
MARTTGARALLYLESANDPMASICELSLTLSFITTFLLSIDTASSDVGGSWGRFVGTVKTEWHDDGRTMQLLDDFGYVDREGDVWKAPKGHKIDGASIPQVFWTFIGGPFEGKYRNASVVHDFECDVRRRQWRAVHRMFYAACRSGGTEARKAKVMFAAVYHFGPRWGPDKGLRPFRTDEDFKRMRDYVESNPDITVEQIEALDQTTLRNFDRRRYR